MTVGAPVSVPPRATSAIPVAAAVESRWGEAELRIIVLRLVLVGAFTALLRLTNTDAWLQTGVLLALISLFPAQRRWLLALSAAVMVYLFPPLNTWLLTELGAAHGADWAVQWWPIAVAGVLLAFAGFVWIVRLSRGTFLYRHPVLVLIALLVGLLIAEAYAPLHGMAWFAVAVSGMLLGNYLWFFAYAIADAKQRPIAALPAQAGFWRPVWGFSNVPLGKGAAYLDRVEAKDAAQLTAVQISGIKLMLWATALSFASNWLSSAIYTPHPYAYPALAKIFAWVPPDGLPTTVMAIDRHVEGQPYPFAVRWEAAIAEFLFSVLYMAVWGHKIIAGCRIAGFNAAPNTDWPLTATSIADFFNRIYYYFKELLATFFFYPTYLRFFKRHPRVRLFAATLAAAGLGNFLFHFLRDDRNLFRLGLWKALEAYHVYGVYCLILGTAIGISQLRLIARNGKPPTGARKVMAIAGVWFFYTLINILYSRSPRNILEQGSFILSLFRP